MPSSRVQLRKLSLLHVYLLGSIERTEKGRTPLQMRNRTAWPKSSQPVCGENTLLRFPGLHRQVCSERRDELTSKRWISRQGEMPVRSCTLHRNNSVVSVSSSKHLRCSKVHPPGPGDEPLGTLFRLRTKTFRSTTTGASGCHSMILCVMFRTTPCGRRDCISCRVASVPAAMVAPVKHCRARETSPI